MQIKRGRTGARAAGLCSCDVSKFITSFVPSFLHLQDCITVTNPSPKEGQPVTSSLFLLLRCPIRCKELRKNPVPVKTRTGQKRESFDSEMMEKTLPNAHDFFGWGGKYSPSSAPGPWALGTSTAGGAEHWLAPVHFLQQETHMLGCYEQTLMVGYRAFLSSLFLKVSFFLSFYTI